MSKNELPHKIKIIGFACDAWLVGSAAKPDAIYADVKDFDVLVPYENWFNAAQLFVPEDAIKNSFGGWKFKIDGIEIDMFPGNLGDFMKLQMGFGSAYVYHIKYRKRWKLL